MYHDPTQTQALLLSKEETFAILDMCLSSRMDTEAAHEQAIEKLVLLARHYIQEEREAQIAAAVDEAAAEMEAENERETERMTITIHAQGSLDRPNAIGYALTCR